MPYCGLILSSPCCLIGINHQLCLRCGWLFGHLFGFLKAVSGEVEVHDFELSQILHVLPGGFVAHLLSQIVDWVQGGAKRASLVDLETFAVDQLEIIRLLKSYKKKL